MDPVRAIYKLSETHKLALNVAIYGLTFEDFKYEAHVRLATDVANDYWYTRFNRINRIWHAKMDRAVDKLNRR